jgi:hypothetical protein
MGAQAFSAVFFEEAERALILATVADLIAIQILEDVGGVGEMTEGERGMHGGDGGVFLIGNGVGAAFLSVDGVGESGHLDTHDTKAAPGGEGHGFDDIVLDGSGGLELGAVTFEDLFKGERGLSGKNDGLGEKAVPDGILSTDGFAFGSDGSGGQA